ncbi:hypothetical protein FRB90_009996, partial [Tulasnella sp. 427]
MDRKITYRISSADLSATERTVMKLADYRKSESDSVFAPPIHSLPVEVLIRIVQTLLGPRPSLRTLVRLTHVCRCWRNVSEGASNLWTWISAREGLAHAEKALKMAQTAPLDIVYDISPARPISSLFINMVCSAFTQWSSFRFECTELVAAESLGRLATTPAPNIIYIKLRNWLPPFQYGETITLFGGAPASATLRHVELGKVRIDLAPLRLSNLRSLDLWDIRAVSENEG